MPRRAEVFRERFAFVAAIFAPEDFDLEVDLAVDLPLDLRADFPADFFATLLPDCFDRLALLLPLLFAMRNSP